MVLPRLFKYLVLILMKNGQFVKCLTFHGIFMMDDCECVKTRAICYFFSFSVIMFVSKKSVFLLKKGRFASSIVYVKHLQSTVENNVFKASVWNNTKYELKVK